MKESGEIGGKHGLGGMMIEREVYCSGEPTVRFELAEPTLLWRYTHSDWDAWRHDSRTSRVDVVYEALRLGLHPGKVEGSKLNVSTYEDMKGGAGPGGLTVRNEG